MVAGPRPPVCENYVQPGISLQKILTSPPSYPVRVARAEWEKSGNRAQSMDGELQPSAEVPNQFLGHSVRCTLQMFIRLSLLESPSQFISRGRSGRETARMQFDSR